MHATQPHSAEPKIPPASKSSLSRSSAPSKRLVLLLLAVSTAGFCLLHRHDFFLWWLEDIPVYSHAVQQWLAGETPYNGSRAPLYFLYPPAFLYIAGIFTHLLPNHWGEGTYIGANILAICAMPLVFSRFYFRHPWFPPLFALLVFLAQPRFTAVLALCGMNVATILYCSAFIAGIPGVRRNFWWLFYITVFLAGIIKITFLALLLLPVLAGRRQWLRSIACAVAVVGMNLVEKMIAPELYSGYKWALQQAILGEKHYGYGVFGILAFYDDKYHHSVGLLPYAGAILVAAALSGSMLLLLRRMKRVGFASTDSNWLALVVSTIILVNPREMQYDVDVALLAAFVLFKFVLCGDRIPSLLQRLATGNGLLVLLILLFLPSLVVPLLIHGVQMHGMYEMFLVLLAYVLGFRRLWLQTAGKPGLQRNSTVNAGTGLAKASVR